MACAGIPAVDGDRISREVVTPGSDCLRELADEFGGGILNNDGTLNRRLLADICFSDADKKRKLDRITHPYIIRVMLAEFERLKDEGHGVCVVEAPALIESGLLCYCDKVVLVSADAEKQEERIISRDGLTEKQAKSRLNAQLTKHDLGGIADYEITNNGSMREFEKQLDKLVELIEQWAIQKTKGGRNEG